MSRVVLLLLLAFGAARVQAQVCDPGGNLFLLSNYDGGIVTINVDVNIPDLVIGISTYEPVQVTITGPFAGNVTQVLYSGMNSDQNNNNCGQGNFTTTITGVPPNIVTINPPMQPLQVGYTPAHNNGTGQWGGVVIGTAGQCDTTANAGGANTPDELVFHFEDQTGASLYAHQTQYACWQNSVVSLSAGGNCCITPPSPDSPCSIGEVAVSTSSISCTGLDDGSITASPLTGGPYSYVWNTVPAQTTPTITGLPSGTYVVQISDDLGCDTTLTIALVDPEPLTLVLSGTSPVCANAEAQATALADGGTGQVTIAWNTGASGAAINYSFANTGPLVATGTDANGCSLSDTLLVLVEQVPTPAFTASADTVCAGNEVDFLANAPGADALSWSLGSAGAANSAATSALFTAPGVEVITLVAFGPNGCSSDPVVDSLVIAPRPELQLLAELVPCTRSIRIQTMVTGADACGLWLNDVPVNVPCGGSFATPVQDEGDYELVLTASNGPGCADTLIQAVAVQDPPGLFIPNVFSPDGDGINEAFTAGVLPGVPGTVLRIFNRWGAELFTTSDMLKGWDGTANGSPVPDGVYLYLLKAPDPCEPKSLLELRGHVTVLR